MKRITRTKRPMNATELANAILNAHSRCVNELDQFHREADTRTANKYLDEYEIERAEVVRLLDLLKTTVIQHPDNCSKCNTVMNQRSKGWSLNCGGICRKCLIETALTEKTNGL